MSPKRSSSRLSVAIVILAAGRSSRMTEGGGHKLLATFDGQSLVRKSVSTALASDCQNVIVVTGCRHSEIAGEIVDLPCEIAHNSGFVTGMAGSLRVGVEAASNGNPDGIMIALADMPKLTAENLDALIAAFRESGGMAVVRAAGSGSPGNPVIFTRNLFNDLRNLTGDVGARALIGTTQSPVIDIEIGDAAHLDVDTAEQIVSEGGTLIDAFPINSSNSIG